MLLLNKVSEGLSWLQESCLLLWQHKKLLLYKLISIAIKLAIMSAFMPGYGKQSFMGILLLFILLFIKYFLDIALSGCTLQILKGNTCLFVASLGFGLNNISQLTWWTSFWVFGKLMASYLNIPAVVVESASSLIMLFVTFYLFPLLASRQLTLPKAVYKSVKLVQKSWIQIIAASVILWPFAKLVGVFTLSVGWPLVFLAWVLGAILMTLVIILRTVAYSSLLSLH
jgi:hypothetical protein